MTKPPKAAFRLYPTDTPHLDKMPGRFRRALEAIDVDGLKYEAAADRLNVPVGSVKSRVHRARARVIALRAEAQAAVPS